MSKAVIALLLSTLLALVTAFWGWSEASKARGLYKEQIELREAAEARLSKVQSSLRTVSSNYATSELRLRRALDAIPDRATPRPVYDELCSRGNCAKLVPLSTPAD